MTIVYACVCVCCSHKTHTSPPYCLRPIIEVAQAAFAQTGRVRDVTVSGMRKHSERKQEVHRVICPLS